MGPRRGRIIRPHRRQPHDLATHPRPGLIPQAATPLALSFTSRTQHQAVACASCEMAYARAICGTVHPDFVDISEHIMSQRTMERAFRLSCQLVQGPGDSRARNSSTCRRLRIAILSGGSGGMQIRAADCQKSELRSLDARFAGAQLT